ncbi:hypothetical protein [Lederbergia citrea]|uniref:Uncharacterized protein n=1 Tax=Lederbergia citrea TaxID=2833581 RepID=A0A942USD2_9BACI|nr:hypothetical protein [Lederbergia citrea]MBS4178852.1 hypothetical protein [Lederbergia citrea]MBS4205532.1 hypothetical protein [Lederbergia citrea]MBS4224133.1 hypothetical protein [Lederbergia citrea]
MILCEWKSFSTDTETYTLQAFEEAVEDEFEAMMYKGDEIPTVIWTSNYVIIVKKFSTLTTDIMFEKIPRNPVCE